jgi:hypothetical protein
MENFRDVLCSSVVCMIVNTILMSIYTNIEPIFIQYRTVSKITDVNISGSSWSRLPFVF